MAFPYNGNIPQANDQLSVSQGQILINFGSIQNLIDVNHEDFTSANAGKHISSTYTRQAADKPTAGNDVAIYSKLNPATNDSELYFRKQNNGTIQPFTGGALTSTGWSYIAPGLVMKWGTQGPPGNPGWPQTINTNFGPAITTLLNVQVTILDATNSLTDKPLGIKSANLVQIVTNKNTNADSGVVSTYWMIIGAI